MLTVLSGALNLSVKNVSNSFHVVISIFFLQIIPIAAMCTPGVSTNNNTRTVVLTLLRKSCTVLKLRLYC